MFGRAAVVALYVTVADRRRCTNGWSPPGVPRRPSAVAPRGDFDDNEIKWLYCR